MQLEKPVQMRTFDGFGEWFCRREHVFDRLEQR